MFVGHYGVSFAAKRVNGAIPLWVLFLAVQWLDVVWAPLVLLGIEKVRIVPGFTATNPLDLYYMPYTHSLIAALSWSVAGTAFYQLLTRTGWRTSRLIGLAIFSHWVLDFVVHAPDLPLYDNAMKVGLGLWNRPALAFGLEATVLLLALLLYLQATHTYRMAIIGFGFVMLGIQAYVFFGPPPVSPDAAAATALAAYAIFAVVIWFLADRHGRRHAA
jgi:hypothetical protein